MPPRYPRKVTPNQRFTELLVEAHIFLHLEARKETLMASTGFHHVMGFASKDRKLISGFQRRAWHSKLSIFLQRAPNKIDAFAVTQSHAHAQFLPVANVSKQCRVTLAAKSWIFQVHASLKTSNTSRFTFLSCSLLVFILPFLHLFLFGFLTLALGLLVFVLS